MNAGYVPPFQEKESEDEKELRESLKLRNVHVPAESINEVLRNDF